MNKLLKNILTPDTNTSAHLYRIGEPFRIVDQMGPLGSHDWVESWKNFRNGKISNNDASRIWENLDATMDFIGEQVYSKITNYVDNIADIDLCGLKSLQSMLDMVGLDTSVAITYPYPTELRELLDLLTINKSLIFGSNNVLSENSKNTVLASLLLARDSDNNYVYPSLAPRDFRELWVSNLDLQYISSNDVPGLTRNAYHTSRLSDGTLPYLTYDTFFATPDRKYYTSEKIIDITDIPSSDIVAYINVEDKKILAYTPEVSTVSSWADPLNPIDGKTLDWIKPYNVKDKHSVYPEDLYNQAFIQLDDTDKTLYYGIAADTKTTKLCKYEFIKPIEASKTPCINLSGTNITLFTITDDNYLNAVHSTKWLFNQPYSIGYNLQDQDLSSYPLVVNTPVSIEITEGPNSVVGTYIKSSDSNIEANYYIQSDSQSPNIFEQTYEYKTERKTSEATSILTISTIFELSGATFSNNKSYVDLTREFNRAYDNVGALYTNIIEGQITKYLDYTSGSIKLQYCSTGRKGNFYKLTTEVNGLVEIFESPSVKNYSSPVPSFDKWELTNNTKGLFDGVIPNTFKLIKIPSNIIWRWYRNGLDNSPYQEVIQPLVENITFPAKTGNETEESNNDNIFTYDTEEIQAVLDENGVATGNTKPVPKSNPILASYVYTVLEPESKTDISINTWKSTDKLNNITLSDEDYSKYCSTLFKTVLTSLVTLPYKFKEHSSETSSVYELSDLVCYNISSKLNDQSLFSTALKYDYNEEAEAKTIKIQNNVPVTFNEQYNYDLIVLGKKSIDDFSEAEQIVLNWENERRSKSKDSTDLTTKYYQLQELKVKEYFKFILNFNAYISNTSILTASVKDYSLDENYFEITDTSVPTLWTSNIDDALHLPINSDEFNALSLSAQNGIPVYINKQIIDNVAIALGKLCLDVAKLRDDAKYHVKKIYKKGTWNLIRNYIIEFLSNTLFKNFANNTQLSGLINNVNNIQLNLVEYSDNEEYFNIKSLPTSAYSTTQLDQLNPQYWTDINDNTNNNVAFRLNDRDISSFYYNTLGLRLVDENGIEIGYDNVSAMTALKSFLTCVYSSGATTETIRNTQYSDNDSLVSAINKYIGTKEGDYPFYNFKNQTHPSYQIHEYIFGLTKYINDTFSLDNLYNAASQEYADNIRYAISSYIDDQGNVINKWIEGRCDFTGYNSNVEKSGINNPIIRNEGPFNLYALSSYVDAVNNETFNESLLYKYFSTNITDEYLKFYTNILSNSDIFLNIVDTVNNKIIYKVATDKYNNIITLYKASDSDNSKGELWFKPDGYPISIPMFNTKDELSLINKTFKGSSPHTPEYILDEITEKNNTNLVYDFEIDPLTNTLALIVDVNNNKEVKLLTISKELNTDTAVYEYFYSESPAKIEALPAKSSKYNFAGCVITNNNDIIGSSHVYVAYTAESPISNYINLQLYHVDLNNIDTGNIEYNTKLNVLYDINYSNTKTILSKSNNNLSLDISIPLVSIATGYGDSSTIFRNYIGYYTDNKDNTSNIGSINAIDIVANNATPDNVEDFINLEMLDSAFISFNLDYNLDNNVNIVPNVYTSFSSNNYYPIFAVSETFNGGNTFYKVPQLKNLPEYKLQYIGKPTGSTQNAFIYEQTLPDVSSDNLYHTSAYHLVQTYRLNNNVSGTYISTPSLSPNIFGSGNNSTDWNEYCVAYYIEAPIKNLIDAKWYNTSKSDLNIVGIDSIDLKLMTYSDYTTNSLLKSETIPPYGKHHHNAFILNAVANNNIEKLQLYLRVLTYIDGEWKLYAQSTNSTTNPTSSGTATPKSNGLNTNNEFNAARSVKYNTYTFNFNMLYKGIVPADTPCRLVFSKYDDPVNIYYPVTYCTTHVTGMGNVNNDSYTYWFYTLKTSDINTYTELTEVSADITPSIINKLEYGVYSTINNNLSNSPEIINTVESIYNSVNIPITNNIELGKFGQDGQIIVNCKVRSVPLVIGNTGSESNNIIDTEFSLNPNYDKVWVNTTTNSIGEAPGFSFNTADISDETLSAKALEELTIQYYTSFINSTDELNQNSINSLSAGIPVVTESSIKTTLDNIIESSNKPYLWKMLSPNSPVDTLDSLSSTANYEKTKSDMVWLTFEHDKTVGDSINYMFAPNSVELSGKVVIDTVVNQIDEVYGKVTLDKGFDIGISYFINENENSKNNDNIKNRTHVTVFALAQAQLDTDNFILHFDLTDRDADNNTPFTQTLSVLSLNTMEIKKYTVNLDKFTAADNYEIKLTIKRV